MLRFLKSKQRGSDVAAGLLDSIRQSYDAGFIQSRNLFPEDAQIEQDAVQQEWLYFQIFLIDFGVYNALGQTPEKATVLTPFWRLVKAWLESVHVAELPDRLAVAGPRNIAAEPSETAFARASRRVEQYASALASPHAQGKTYSVAAVFAASCGTMDAACIAGIAAYFSSMVSQLTEAFVKIRVVP